MLPLLLLVIFAVIDFGRLLNAQIIVTQAAREGARAEALGGDPATHAATAASGIGSVTVAVSQVCPEPVTPSYDARVTVSHQFEFITPLGAIAGSFASGGGQGSLVVTGQGVMSCVQ